MDVARRAERPMRRRVDIRTIYERIKVRYPDAYIAIQSGDFVSFILSQARELRFRWERLLVGTSATIRFPSTNSASMISRGASDSRRTGRWSTPSVPIAERASWS